MELGRKLLSRGKWVFIRDHCFVYLPQVDTRSQATRFLPRHNQIGDPWGCIHPLNDARVQEFLQFIRYVIPQGKGQPPQGLDGWAHCWVNELVDG